MTPSRTGGSQNTSCIVPEGKKMSVLFGVVVGMFSVREHCASLVHFKVTLMQNRARKVKLQDT